MPVVAVPVTSLSDARHNAKAQQAIKMLESRKKSTNRDKCLTRQN